MNREWIKGLLVGFVSAGALFALAASAFASSGTFALNATYANIRLVVDGKTVEPKDANGVVVEPFIVNGTTYLPVRAVAEALGKEVSWDGAKKTVRVGAPGTQPADPVTPSVSPIEAALRQWLKDYGADFTSAIEQYFGEGTKVYTRTNGKTIIFEISKTTTSLPTETRLKLEEAFMSGLSDMASGYQQILDLIRADTGYKDARMEVWHYFDATLVYMQDLS